MSNFKQIDPAEIQESVFKLVGTDWMLITAGAPESFNTMTASWGGLGVIWGKNVGMCVVRPTRHTYSFMEDSDYFTLTFFPEEHRGALTFCGTKSGRDVDKCKETGLTPAFTETGAPYFEEARIVMVCKKLYWHDIDPAQFVDPEIDRNYPQKDYHRMYIGEIVECLAR